MADAHGPVDEFLTTAFERIGRGLVKRPRIVLLALAAITIALGAFIPTLKLNNDGRIYFIEGDPMLVAQDNFEQTFGSEQFVMFFLESETLFSPEHYKTVDALVKKLEAIRYEGALAFQGVLSPFHAPALKPGTGALDFAPIVDKPDPTAADMERAKKIATEHPVYGRSLVNREGTVAVVVASMKAVPGDAMDYSQFVADAVTDIFETHPGLKELNARLVGAPVFGAEMNLVTAKEAALFGSASVLVCIIALFLMFRVFRQVLGAILVVIASTIWTIGSMAAVGAEMSLVHALLPPAIIVTGLGSGIHVINEYRLLSTAMIRREALIHAIRGMGGPCMLTAITTGIGFLAMLTAPVGPMRTLGLFIAVGVFLSFVLAMVLVPAVLLVGADGLDEQELHSALRERSSAFFHWLAEKVVGHARLWAIALALVAGVLIAGVRTLEVDTMFLHALREDHPFRQTVEYVDEKIGGSHTLELVLDTGVPNGAFNPELLKRLAELQHFLETEEHGMVSVTLSVADLYKEISLALVGERKLPETAEQAAAYLGLYDLNGGVTRNIIDADRQKLRMSARAHQISADEFEALEQSLRKKAEALFSDLEFSSYIAPAAPVEPAPTESVPVEEDGDEVLIIDDEGVGATDGPAPAAAEDDVVIIDEGDDAPPAVDDKAAASPRAEPVPDMLPPKTVRGAKIEIAGSAYLFAKLNDYVIDSQLRSFTLAAIIIGFIMIFMLRSAVLGAAIMIPNVLPVFATYGTMGWLGLPLDFMTAVIAVAAIGVAVDGTIHIGTRYRRAIGQGHSASEAAMDVMTSVGRALVVTSLVLTAGFCVLAPSVMATLARFGVMMAFCLFLALVYDLIMTPAVLAWLSPGKKQ